jgi:hypothetical protein
MGRVIFAMDGLLWREILLIFRSVCLIRQQPVLISAQYTQHQTYDHYREPKHGTSIDSGKELKGYTDYIAYKRGKGKGLFKDKSFFLR